MKDAALASGGVSVGAALVLGAACGWLGLAFGEGQEELAQAAATGSWGLFVVMPAALVGLALRSPGDHKLGRTVGGAVGGVLGSLLFVVVVAQIGNVFGRLDSTTTAQVVLQAVGWGRLGAAMLATAAVSAAAGFGIR